MRECSLPRFIRTAQRRAAVHLVILGSRAGFELIARGAGRTTPPLSFDMESSLWHGGAAAVLRSYEGALGRGTIHRGYEPLFYGPNECWETVVLDIIASFVHRHFGVVEKDEDFVRAGFFSFVISDAAKSYAASLEPHKFEGIGDKNFHRVATDFSSHGLVQWAAFAEAVDIFFQLSGGDAEVFIDYMRQGFWAHGINFDVLFSGWENLGKKLMVADTCDPIAMRNNFYRYLSDGLSLKQARTAFTGDKLHISTSPRVSLDLPVTGVLAGNIVGNFIVKKEREGYRSSYAPYWTFRKLYEHEIKLDDFFSEIEKDVPVLRKDLEKIAQEIDVWAELAHGEEQLVSRRELVSRGVVSPDGFSHFYSPAGN